MSTYRFENLFAPRSIAVVGGSPRETSVGRAMLRNIRGAGFRGAVHLVNPTYAEIDGLAAVARLEDLPAAPDLVVVSAPSATVPSIIAVAAERGSAAAIVVSGELGSGAGSLADACTAAAHGKRLRLLGPNCLGVVVPGDGLNASLAARLPRKGDLAVISQSAAVASGIIEWAAQRSIGFSALVSSGDQLDVDVGDLLDWFAVDDATRAILVYLDSITDARKFMSAARAAARAKPVVVVKAGRHVQIPANGPAGRDAVYDAAFRRAGLLRVRDLGELFDAAETLGHVRKIHGGRLAILANGAGIGSLAADRLIDLGGTPAQISAATRERFRSVLPHGWVGSSSIDISGDADAERYANALQSLLQDEANDAVLVMNVQTALSSAQAAAEAVVAQVRAHRRRSAPPKPVLAVWVGADQQVSATFNAADIPHYGTETDAVRGFMHLVRHRDAMRTLMRTPPSLPAAFRPDVATARGVVTQALGAGRSLLDADEAVTVLRAYAVPVDNEPGGPRSDARALMAGIADDPVFGPVIVFGAGGAAATVADDVALALPPLDLGMAADLIARTRLARTLGAYGGRAPADVDAIALTLVKLAHLAADLPEVRELTIDPLLAGATGVAAAGARIVVRRTDPSGLGSANPRFAVRPYPNQWERWLDLPRGAPVFVRPVRPEDEPLFHQFLEKTSLADLRLRFFSAIKDFDHAFIARLTQLDYARAMAFAAIDRASGELLGVVRVHADHRREAGEYAIITRSDVRRRGLAGRLMEHMIDYARGEGLQRVEGSVLSENTAMLSLCRKLGFRVEHQREDPSVSLVTLPLTSAGAAVVASRPALRGNPRGTV